MTCKLCGDSGKDKKGNPCVCVKKSLETSDLVKRFTVDDFDLRK